MGRGRNGPLSGRLKRPRRSCRYPGLPGEVQGARGTCLPVRGAVPAQWSAHPPLAPWAADKDRGRGRAPRRSALPQRGSESALLTVRGVVAPPGPTVRSGHLRPSLVCASGRPSSRDFIAGCGAPALHVRASSPVAGAGSSGPATTGVGCWSFRGLPSRRASVQGAPGVRFRCCSWFSGTRSGRWGTVSAVRAIRGVSLIRARSARVLNPPRGAVL